MNINFRTDQSSLGDRLYKVTDEDVRQSKIDERNLPYNPVITAYNGVQVRLSAAFSHMLLTASSVDRTGRQPKLVFVASVEATLKPKMESDFQLGVMEFSRPVNLSVSVPDMITVSVEERHCLPYLSPASTETAFTQMGSWVDKSGALKFYNSLAALNEHSYVSAAIQMGIFYMEYYLLPALGQPGARNAFQAVADQGHRAQPQAHHTCFIPHEIAARHSPEAICILYHALEARQVSAAAGVPDWNNVFNQAGAIPQTLFTIEAWFEAYHILALSACGSGSRDRFDLDVLLPIIQNFKLHGNTDEGGIFRRIFNKIPIMKNSGIMCSSYRKQSTGYHDRSINHFLGSAIAIQSTISRALMETKMDLLALSTGPAPTNHYVSSIIESLRGEVVDTLSDFTAIDCDYWNSTIYKQLFEPNEIQDRHISNERPNCFTHYTTALPSFHDNTLPNSIHGHFTNPSNSAAFVKFTGSGNAEYLRIDNDLYLNAKLDDTISFSNPLFWLMPGINKHNGIVDVTFTTAFQRNNLRSVDQVYLHDGTTLNTGDDLSTACWADNGDLFLPRSMLYTTVKGPTLVRANDLSEKFNMYDYSVSVSKYKLLGQQKGEAKAHLAEGNSRIQTHIKRVYGDIVMYDNDNERRMVSLETFYRDIKGLSSNRYKSILTKHIEAAMANKQYLDSLDDAREMLGLEDIPTAGEVEVGDCITQHLTVQYRTRELVKMMTTFLDTVDRRTSMDEIMMRSRDMGRLHSNSLARRLQFSFPTRENFMDATEQVSAEMKEVGYKGDSKLRLVYGNRSTPRVFDLAIFKDEIESFVHRVAKLCEDHNAVTDGVINNMFQKDDIDTYKQKYERMFNDIMSKDFETYTSQYGREASEYTRTNPYSKIVKLEVVDFSKNVQAIKEGTQKVALTAQTAANARAKINKGEVATNLSRTEQRVLKEDNKKWWNESKAELLRDASRKTTIPKDKMVFLLESAKRDVDALSLLEKVVGKDELPMKYTFLKAAQEKFAATLMREDGSGYLSTRAPAPERQLTPSILAQTDTTLLVAATDQERGEARVSVVSFNEPDTPVDPPNVDDYAEEQ